jgi:2-dehydro-3-deoxygluconokinase
MIINEMENVFEQVALYKIIPVIRIDDVSKAIPLAKALKDGGLPVAEITFRTKEAEQAIAKITSEMPEMLVGAGTVLTIEQVDKAIHAGAKFIVSPGLNPRIVQYCIDKKIPIIPGCSNAGNIEQALELGINVVKFFPAEQAGGVEMIKALAAPYINVKFIPTGGINEGNINKYLSFGKVLACGGSWMVNQKLIDEGNYEKITSLTRKAVAITRPVDEEVSREAKIAKVADFSKKEGSIVTFGEIMLRLAPQGYLRFTQANSFEAIFGGGEANVAASLANFGAKAKFVTKLPSHDIGNMAMMALKKVDVDTSAIVRGGKRVGIYYLEKGASQRPSKVIYDRAGSSVAEASKDDFNWDEIFSDAKWFHFTGITPALGDNVAEICKLACIAAKRRNIVISCDLNFRKNLWTSDKANKIMTELMKYVDVCIANEEDAEKVFGIKAENSNVTAGTINKDGYKSVAKQLADQFGCKFVAITLRSSISASDNNWAAMLYDGDSYYFSKEYKVHIVDRVGGGDSFGAGLIYGLTSGYSSSDSLEFATAASCLKHSIEGDINAVTVSEVLALMGGDGSGRVQR